MRDAHLRDARPEAGWAGGMLWLRDACAGGCLSRECSGRGCSAGEFRGCWEGRSSPRWRCPAAPPCHEASSTVGMASPAPSPPGWTCHIPGLSLSPPSAPQRQRVLPKPSSRSPGDAPPAQPGGKLRHGELRQAVSAGKGLQELQTCVYTNKYVLLFKYIFLTSSSNCLNTENT